MSDGTQWGWDLVRQRAVPWNERGPGENILGPYPSREAAEDWKSTVEARNTKWDEDDEAWTEGDTSE